MRSSLLILALLLTSACGGETPVTPPEEADAGAVGGGEQDAGETGEGGEATDGGPQLDGGAEADAGSDAGTEIDGGSDAGTADAGTTTDGGFPASWEPVQCRVEPDCPGISSCNRNAPGGVCIGCGTSADCPGGIECFSGACVQDCSSDADCNPGMRCGSDGRCRIRACPCPAPYVCGSTNFCERPSCETTPCPSPFTCEAGVCVEP